jgi:hypothetical protein
VHEFVPLIPASTGHSGAVPAIPSVVQIQQAKTTYDRTVRLSAQQIEALVVPLKADLGSIPSSNTKKYRERLRLLNALSVLHHVAGTPDHKHDAWDEFGCFLDLQNFIIEDIQTHLVPDASLREVSRQQCHEAVARIIPLPEPPSPSPSVPRSAASAGHQQQQQRQQKQGRRHGGGGGRGGGGKNNAPPPAATVAPSATRSGSGTRTSTRR